MEVTKTKKAAKWILDHGDSLIAFKTANDFNGIISGQIVRFHASMTKDFDNFNNFDNIQIECYGFLDSLETGNRERNSFILGSGYLNCLQFPKISLISTSLKKVSKGGFVQTTSLTIHGVTRDIPFRAVFRDLSSTVWGYTKACINLTAKIKISEWEIKPPKHANGEISLNIELQFSKK